MSDISSKISNECRRKASYVTDCIIIFEKYNHRRKINILNFFIKNVLFFILIEIMHFVNIYLICK